MKAWMLGLGALAAIGGSGLAPPAQAASCGDRAAECEASCTPAKVARYYFGSERRCTASCEPRLQQCYRTGKWTHLEDYYPGNVERVSRF